MINEKIQRGTYGYIDYRKKNLGIKSLIIGAFVVVIGIIGYIIFGTIRNYLMIPSMISVIPFANSFATFVAVFKFRTEPADRYSMVRNFDDEGMLLSDLIIVDKDGKRFPVPFAVIHSSGITAYSYNTENNYKPEIQINDTLKNRGLNYRIKIETDFDTFISKLENVYEIEDKDTSNLVRETLINCSM